MSDDDAPMDDPRVDDEGPVPVRRRKREDGGRGGRAKKKGGSAVLLFLLFGAAPAALAGWFFLMPEEKQAAVLEKLPEGTGGRALKAGICLAVLFGLAKIALPAFHGTGAWLRGALQKLRANGTALRILLFPVELVVWLVWSCWSRPCSPSTCC